ncbi:MAG TPA: hypothetical protein PK916_10275 [Bacteroidota bacterium]|nr:hypothetical protein [Bacteroidota bacterium]
MTIHDMMQQVALLSYGTYKRDGDVSRIEIRTPGDRTQVLYGRVQRMADEDVGVLYTFVGRINEDIDARALLELNAALRHARVALLHGEDIFLLALFDLVRTSINECAPILQELAAVADDLEHRWYSVDNG